MIGGVGQRMLTRVSRRMAGEFFGNVDAAIAGGPVAAAVTAPEGATVESGAHRARRGRSSPLPAKASPAGLAAGLPHSAWPSAPGSSSSASSRGIFGRRR